MKLYETTEFIEFSQTDPAGILFFSRSFEIYHRSLEKWVSNKMGWDRFFTNPDFAFVYTLLLYHNSSMMSSNLKEFEPQK